MRLRRSRCQTSELEDSEPVAIIEIFAMPRTSAPAILREAPFACIYPYTEPGFAWPRPGRRAPASLFATRAWAIF